MKVVRESADDLVICVPATGAILRGGCFLVIGLALMMTVLVPLTMEFLGRARADGQPRAWVLFGLGAFIAVLGPLEMARRQGKEFHFARKQHSLFVRRFLQLGYSRFTGRTEKIPLSHIVTAETSADLTDVPGLLQRWPYRLHLKLKGFMRDMEIARATNRTSLKSMEKRINQFLAGPDDSERPKKL